MSEKCDCGSLEQAKKEYFCMRQNGGEPNCKYYKPLEGEFETKIVKKTRQRYQCSLCKNPADYKITYLYSNARANPRSRAYGRHDDISFCQDDEQFACEEHKEAMYKHPDDQNKWERTFEFCASSPLNRFQYMGLHWIETEYKPIDSPVVNKVSTEGEKK
jgi:hypothetical protein